MVHLFFDSAIFEEVGFDEVNHFIEHRNGLIYNGQHHVAKFFIGQSVGETHEKFSLIVVATGFAQICETWVVLIPYTQPARAHIILIVI